MATLRSVTRCKRPVPTCLVRLIALIRHVPKICSFQNGMDVLAGDSAAQNTSKLQTLHEARRTSEQAAAAYGFAQPGREQLDRYLNSIVFSSRT
jgi:hypothetical protein